MRKRNFPEKVAVFSSPLLKKWIIAIGVVKLSRDCWNCSYKIDTITMKKWMAATDVVK